MNKKTLQKELLKMAAKLDAVGLYREASMLDAAAETIQKIALNALEDPNDPLNDPEHPLNKQKPYSVTPASKSELFDESVEPGQYKATPETVTFNEADVIQGKPQQKKKEQSGQHFEFVGRTGLPNTDTKFNVSAKTHIHMAQSLMNEYLADIKKYYAEHNAFPPGISPKGGEKVLNFQPLETDGVFGPLTRIMASSLLGLEHKQDYNTAKELADAVKAQEYQLGLAAKAN